MAEVPSARQILRQRLAALRERHPEMTVPDIADLFAHDLVDQDRHLVEQFLASEARNILAYELRAQTSQIRHGIFAKLEIKNPDAPVEQPREEIRDSLRDRISQWREFVPIPGINGRGMIVLEMTKEELRQSAQYDAARINKFGWKMIVKERLADGLQDGERVMDRFAPDEVAALISRTREEMASGNFRIRLNPIVMPRSITDGNRGQGQRRRNNQG